MIKQQIQLIPRLSANDVELKIVCWLVQEGDFVAKGQDLCTLESSKSVSDTQAEFEGYVYFLAQPGESVEIGKPLAIFAGQKTDHVKKDFLALKPADLPAQAGDKKFTKKAELIAKQYQVDIKDIQKEGVIREEDVLNFVNGQVNNKRYEGHEKLNPPVDLQLKKRVIIIGAGVGAAQLVDIIVRGNQQRVVGLLDDNASLHGKTIFDQKILGPVEMIHSLWKSRSFDGAIVSFSKNLSVRKKVFSELFNAGIPFTNVIDPSAQFNSNVSLGVGNVILAQAVIAASVRIGNNNFIGSHAVIEHHSIIGDGCGFGPGVMTSGEVKIGDQVKLGTGIFIEPLITIGSRSTISSGIAVTMDIPEDVVVKKDMDYKIVKKS